ncbi:MAG: chromate transporter [Hylemonella sp.]
MQSEPEALAPRLVPHSLSELFFSFTWLALQGFGGVLTVVQREMVEKKRWMSNEEFIEEWAVAQVLPGPNVINLALMFGGRHFGLRGALVSLAGIIAVPLLLVLVLAMVYAHFSSYPGVAGALRGMGAVAGGLIAATGFKLLKSLHKHPLGFRHCLALGLVCFVAVGLLRLPLVAVLLVLGGIGVGLSYRKLGR